MSSMEVIQSKKSKDLSTQNSKGFVEENQDTDPSFKEDGVHSTNGNSRHGLTKKDSAADRVKLEDKQANTKTDLWWLNLRYVFSLSMSVKVILMRRDSKEGSEGFYSLKFTSKEQDRSDDSFTIAFEDHADANNFCFVLESFFEDLESFSADAIPMSIQDLNEEILSHANKMVVVKKRQLQLYAGQPLADAEMALHLKFDLMELSSGKEMNFNTHPCAFEKEVRARATRYCQEVLCLLEVDCKNNKLYSSITPTLNQEFLLLHIQISELCLKHDYWLGVRKLLVQE
ncbi:unnamed protein product [Sphenostylis stenocarpa]|uniref:Uncharacterized protein n=1 Tax=Sphenostylis stenocarpa TaxID=92480 RepID=A0AA86VCZ8_9FABA|nr:unnamed protein product [Sphenostylis stenocarpa]